MKRLLLIAAALLALTGAVDAAPLPKYLAQHSASSWCEEVLRSDSEWTVIRMTGWEPDGQRCMNPKAQPSTFWIGSRGKFGSGEDSTCTPLRVSKARASGHYALEWTIVARCQDHDTREPETRIETFIFNLFKGSELTLSWQSR
jgi:hypothetical protein